MFSLHLPVYELNVPVSDTLLRHCFIQAALVSVRNIEDLLYSFSNCDSSMYMSQKVFSIHPAFAINLSQILLNVFLEQCGQGFQAAQ